MIFQIENVDVRCNAVLNTMSANRCFAKTAVIGSEIFVLSGYDKKVRKISYVDVSSKSTWKKLSSMPHSRTYFSVCSFIKSIYLVGGSFQNNVIFYGKYVLRMCFCLSNNLNNFFAVCF